MHAILLDACVLFPNYLRDMFLTLAEQELFRPEWSSAILDEVRRNVLAKRQVDQRAFDRHVLAAAIVGGARSVVTFDLGDFPARLLRPHRIEASHPDSVRRVPVGEGCRRCFVVDVAWRRQSAGRS